MQDLQNILETVQNQNELSLRALKNYNEKSVKGGKENGERKRKRKR